MTEMEEPVWMVCQDCHVPLSSYHPTDGGPIIYLHPGDSSGTSDHDPVPIPREMAAQVVMECDFCSSPDVAWVYPTTAPIDMILAATSGFEDFDDHDTMRDHTIRAQRATKLEVLQRHQFSPDWCACESCARLIDRFDAAALAHRVAKLRTPRLPQNKLRKFFGDFLRKKGPKRRPGPTG